MQWPFSFAAALLGIHCSEATKAPLLSAAGSVSVSDVETVADDADAIC